MLRIQRGNLGLFLLGTLFLVVLGSVWAEAEHHPAEADQAGLASLNQRDVREAAPLKRKNNVGIKKGKKKKIAKRKSEKNRGKRNRKAKKGDHGLQKTRGNRRKNTNAKGNMIKSKGNKKGKANVRKGKRSNNKRKIKAKKGDNGLQKGRRKMRKNTKFRRNRKGKKKQNSKGKSNSKKRNRKNKTKGRKRKQGNGGEKRRAMRNREEKKRKIKSGSGSLEDADVRDYRFSLNQRRKAIRIQKIIKTLQKKVNNSKSFFIEGTMFFKDCAAGKTVFDSLSKCNQTASTACDTSDVIQFNSVLYNRLDQCIENLDTSINSINDCIDINAPICAFIPPDKNCNFNRFENEVKDVRDNCVNPQKNGSFAFCTRLLKDSYDIALLCCGKTTTGSSTTTATTTAITTTTTVTTVTRRTKREIRIDVINQLRGHHFFNSYQKN